MIYTSSTGHRKCQWNCLLSSTKGGCSRQGGVFGVSHLPLHIPSIPMTCGEHTCRCISTSYSIKASHSQKSCHLTATGTNTPTTRVGFRGGGWSTGGGGGAEAAEVADATIQGFDPLTIQRSSLPFGIILRQPFSPDQP